MANAISGPPPAAVIFDMDGLLLDSEAVMRRCFGHVIAAQGWVLPDGVFESLIGLPQAPSLEILDAHVPRHIGIAAFDAAIRRAYDAEMRKGIPLKPGALALARHLFESAIPIAVATSTITVRAHHKLETAGLLPFMSTLACGDDVVNGKPAPDIYFLAAARLGQKPADCLVFEDSPNGVRAAVAAGMRVIQVPDLVAPEPGIESHGVIIAESLLAGAALAGIWSIE